MLCSYRGIPLVRQEHSSAPILTVENYCKWYALWLITPDDHVSQVPFPEDGYCDHVPFPAAVQKLADRNGWLVDDQSMEMMVGRYMLEVRDEEVEDLD